MVLLRFYIYSVGTSLCKSDQRGRVFVLVSENFIILYICILRGMWYNTKMSNQL